MAPHRDRYGTRPSMNRTAAHIRPYRPGDLDALYEICLLTGDGGQDATSLFADPMLLGHFFAAPYGLFPHPWPSCSKTPKAWAATFWARSIPGSLKNSWKATGGPACAPAIPTPRLAFRQNSGHATSTWHT